MMKRKKIKGFAVICFCIFAVISYQSAFAAYDLSLQWDANTETNLVGYKIYYKTGTSGPAYNGTGLLEGASPIIVGKDVTSIILHNCEDDMQYFAAVTAYNTDQLESEFSNEVDWHKNGEFILAGHGWSTFLTETVPGVNDGIFFQYDKINILLATPPSDARTAFVKKAFSESLQAGTITQVEFDLRLKYGQDNTPVSLYLEDNFGRRLSPERVIYVGSSFARFTSKLICLENSNSVNVIIVIGHGDGQYEFARVKISTYLPDVLPIADVYLNRLEPSSSGARYMAVYKVFTSPLSDEVLVRVTKTNIGAELLLEDDIITEIVLYPGEEEFAIEVGSNVYGGVNTETGYFFSVVNIVNGEESVEYLYGELAGNFLNTVDDIDDTPLYFQMEIDYSEYMYVRSAYLYNNVSVPAPENDPAVPQERIDVDNNGKSGRITDFSFIRAQHLNEIKLK